MKIWTKICGITREEDALAAAELGADAIGINFHAASARCCAPERAAAIRAAVRGARTEVYGVFVRESAGRIAELVAEIGLTGVQLHGEESDAEIDRVRSLLATDMPILRAVPVTSRARVEEALARALGWRILLDSPRGGGSGTRFREDFVDGLDLSGAVVAGGLTAENVSGIVARLRPFGVDTAGGVECESGVKDRGKMREFIEHANAGAA